MSSLISDDLKATLTPYFENLFDTFQRIIIVYKESTKTLVNNNTQGFVYGFGAQGENNYIYTEVTGVFPAKIKYGKSYADQNATIEPNSNAYVYPGLVTIKVKKDCRDFINLNKTEKIVFDGRTFFINGNEREHKFLNSEMYSFELIGAK